jgi:ABC-type polysaccharide/polyol phosphate export permease
MSIIAVFDESIGKNAIILIVLSTLFGIVQFIDNRKAQWDWPYIIVLCAMFLLFSAFSAFVTELIFMRYVWLGELVFFCVFVLLLLRKKKG